MGDPESNPTLPEPDSNPSLVARDRLFWKLAKSSGLVDQSTLELPQDDRESRLADALVRSGAIDGIATGVSNRRERAQDLGESGRVSATGRPYGRLATARN